MMLLLNTTEVNKLPVEGARSQEESSKAGRGAKEEGGRGRNLALTYVRDVSG